MKITNSKGFSQSWVRACEYWLSQYDSVGSISCTELIDSPRISVLRRRHKDEITVDVSSLMWLLLGQVMHKILEESADPNAIAEQRILVPYDGWQISMKADHIDPIPGKPGEFSVQDYKISGSWAYRHGVSPSQEAQNNLYRFGYSLNGIKCTAGELEMFIKDFSLLEKQKQGRDYPDAEVVRLPVVTWTQEKCEAYLSERIALHKHARTCTDDDLPECTLHERWGEPDRFAVKFVTNGKVAERACNGASRFETRGEADQWIKAKKTGKQYVVEFRPGENKRCERDACWVSRFCSQWNTKLNPAF